MDLKKLISEVNTEVLKSQLYRFKGTGASCLLR